MLGDKLHNVPSQDNYNPSGVYSPDILPLMQSLLATLADIDLEHEQELSKVETSTTRPNVRAHIVKELTERHQERRQAYVQQLSVLQQCMLRNLPH